MSKDFYVDFGSWIITARNEAEAEKKALRRIKQGEIPKICEVMKTDG